MNNFRKLLEAKELESGTCTCIQEPSGDAGLEGFVRGDSYK